MENLMHFFLIFKLAVCVSYAEHTEIHVRGAVQHNVGNVHKFDFHMYLISDRKEQRKCIFL